jgi:hypothetical protein
MSMKKCKICLYPMTSRKVSFGFTFKVQQLNFECLRGALNLRHFRDLLLNRRTTALMCSFVISATFVVLGKLRRCDR